MTIIPNYVPGGFKVMNVMLAVKNAPHALEWYNRAFGAEEVMRLTAPDGTIAHAEMKIADHIFMLTEEDPEHNASPQTLGGTSVIIHLFTPDVDAFAEEAVKAGAEIIFPVKLQFYGAKSGRIKDPFGHQWIIATHVETVTVTEMQKRFNDLF